MLYNGSNEGDFICGTHWLLNDTEVSNDAASGNASAHVNETEITVENEDTVTHQVEVYFIY
jgi:hypothetical protein